MKVYKNIDFPASNGRRFPEPGPVVLVSAATILVMVYLMLSGAEINKFQKANL